MENPGEIAGNTRLLTDKWIAVRRDRNRKLAETDYLALSDNTISGDMQIYRQKLRDVPKDNSDPDDITWPAKP
jgi:hypothetical protein